MAWLLKYSYYHEHRFQNWDQDQSQSRFRSRSFKVPVLFFIVPGTKSGPGPVSYWNIHINKNICPADILRSKFKNKTRIRISNKQKIDHWIFFLQNIENARSQSKIVLMSFSFDHMANFLVQFWSLSRTPIFMTKWLFLRMTKVAKCGKKAYLVHSN